MNKEKLILIVKGAIKHLPGVKNLLPPMKTGGTNESRYCYSVWLRHLKHWGMFVDGLPHSIAELGPGDSLGTGLAALLSGCKSLYALDVIKYWDNSRNLKIFEELIPLFRQKADIPGPDEYPKVKPLLDDYRFPSYILSDEILSESLSENRLNTIRDEIRNIDNPNNTYIRYKIPWNDAEVIDKEAIDFIYSQAVLECIDDLDNTFKAMCKWLRNTGLMSHNIDFKSHGLTQEWNGHWVFNDLEWYLVKGGRTFLVNRKTLSEYIKVHSKFGFDILDMKPVKLENRFSRTQLAKQFRNLSEEDLTTAGVYIISTKMKERC